MAKGRTAHAGAEVMVVWEERSVAARALDSRRLNFLKRWVYENTHDR